MARARVAREEHAAYAGADAVGADDEVGLDVAVGGADDGRAVGAAGVPERAVHPGPYGVRGQRRGEDVHECGAVQQDDRPAEPLGGGSGVRTGEPAPARRTQAAVALPRGQVTDLVTEADDVQCALRVGGHAEGGSHGGEGVGALQDGDGPAPPAQGHRGGQSADSTADDNGSGPVHGFSRQRELHL